MTDPQLLDFAALLLPSLGQRQHGVLVTGDHDRGGTVDRAKHDPALQTRQRRQNLLL